METKVETLAELMKRYNEDRFMQNAYGLRCIGPLDWNRISKSVAALWAFAEFHVCVPDHKKSCYAAKDLLSRLDRGDV